MGKEGVRSRRHDPRDEEERQGDRGMPVCGDRDGDVHFVTSPNALPSFLKYTINPTPPLWAHLTASSIP
jgi:hypothetical protein